MTKLENKKERPYLSHVSPSGQEDHYLLPVTNVSRKSGISVVDLRFLRDWLGAGSDKFLEAIRRKARRSISAQTTYSSRCVLQLWAEVSISKNWPPPSAEMPEVELRQQLSCLRELFFSNQVKAGNALTTAGNHWNQFTKLIDDLIGTKAVPFIARTDSRIASPSLKLLLANRAISASSHSPVSNAPRNLNVAQDSFNDELFEPISIVASDDEYLEDYQMRLEHAIDTVKACALKDFEELERKYQVGKDLISQFDIGLLQKFKGKDRNRFVDQASGKSLLEAPDEYPDILKTLLGIVAHDMGGIPQPYFYEKPFRKHYADGGKTYWKAIQRYNKNRLLPYLGIMNSEAAGICILLIMLEQPRFNATSMYRARITKGKNGKSCIETSGLTKEGALRFTVTKPRAGEDKSDGLTALTKRVLARVIEWTQSTRDALLEAGRKDEAEMLWVGMSSHDYRMIQFSEKTLFASVNGNSQWRSYGKVANLNRITAFVDRHPELKSWADKLTLKSIRVNVGVLVYIQSGGDLVATARAFGHKNVATTIGNYIPDALRFAIYERQIRRHQNRLLAISVKSELDQLKVTDFRTTEELHIFLKSLRQDINVVDNTVLSDSKKSQVDRKKILIICDDPDALAVAMIYRDRLKGATEKFLDKPDAVTGVKPRFLCEFVDSVVNSLPISMAPITKLVRDANERRAFLEPKISFPEII